ncbi:MAG: hypothetical protein ACJ8BW_22550 [Ktedonobacteraceae bacterium]
MTTSLAVALGVLRSPWGSCGYLGGLRSPWGLGRNPGPFFTSQPSFG